MSAVRRAVRLARDAVRPPADDGAFDGVVSRRLSGWTRSGGAVTVTYGGAVVGQGTCTTNRPELARLGVSGRGFSIPTLALEAHLDELIAAEDDTPRALSAATASGPLLQARGQLVAPSHLLALIALSSATSVLGADTSLAPI